MRAIIQRVSEAEVSVESEVLGSINNGMVILLGISAKDEQEVIDKMIRKILNLRIFNDEEGKMNLNITQASGELMLISQFTLYTNVKKGNRPSYIEAASPKDAELIYDLFKNRLNSKAENLKVTSGQFGDNMQVKLINDGPVTIILDSDLI